MENSHCSEVGGKELSEKPVIAFIVNNLDDMVKDEG